MLMTSSQCCLLFSVSFIFEVSLYRCNSLVSVFISVFVIYRVIIISFKLKLRGVPLFTFKYLCTCYLCNVCHLFVEYRPCTCNDESENK